MWKKLMLIGAAIVSLAVVLEGGMRVLYADHYGGFGPNGFYAWKKHDRRNSLDGVYCEF